MKHVSIFKSYNHQESQGTMDLTDELVALLEGGAVKLVPEIVIGKGETRMLVGFMIVPCMLTDGMKRRAMKANREDLLTANQIDAAGNIFTEKAPVSIGFTSPPKVVVAFRDWAKVDWLLKVLRYAAEQWDSTNEMQAWLVHRIRESGCMLRGRVTMPGPPRYSQGAPSNAPDYQTECRCWPFRNRDHKNLIARQEKWLFDLAIAYTGQWGREVCSRETLSVMLDDFEEYRNICGCQKVPNCPTIPPPPGRTRYDAKLEPIYQEEIRKTKSEE